MEDLWRYQLIERLILMTSYEYGNGADSTAKGGATNNGGRSAPSNAPSMGSGAIPAVQGSSSPVTAKGGVVNNGTDNVPHVNKGR